MKKLYDFKCNNCGAVEEKLVEYCTTMLECSVCGDMMTRQLSSTGSFHFKGNGFYATDFKGKK